MQSSGFGSITSSLSCGSSQRWKFAVRRIDDKRSSKRRHYFVSAIPPEIVIGAADIGLLRPVTAIFIVLLEQLFFVFGGFLFRKELFTGKLVRPFQRCYCREAPHTLQVWLAIRRACRTPFLRRLLCSDRRDQQDRRQ